MVVSGLGKALGVLPGLGVCLGHWAEAQDACSELCPALDTH